MSAATSLPFHSPRVREALAEAVASEERRRGRREGRRGGEAPSSARGGATTAVPGRRRRASSDSSSDDAEGADGRAGEDDASSSSSSSDDNDEEEGDNNELPTTNGEAAAPAAPSGDGGRPRKKDKKAPGGDAARRRMGKAPSVLLPLGDAAEADGADDEEGARRSTRRALEVPRALLPPSVPRDDVRAAAASLLASWDRLRDSATVVVVLIRSGRFAAAVYSLQLSKRSSDPNDAEPAMTAVAHKTSTRYTTRRGQGGSQSQHDQSKSKAKSVGAQLRREGEKQLREDARSTWREWRRRGYLDDAAECFFVSCPKGMRREYLFGGDDALTEKDDERIRSVPLDVGRPSMDATRAVLDCLLSCGMRDMTEEEIREVDETADAETHAFASAKLSADDHVIRSRSENQEGAKPEESTEGPATPEAPPLTPLHEAVVEGDLKRLLELLTLIEESEERDATQEDDAEQSSSLDYDVNTPGGPDGLTPLHAAAASSDPSAPALLDALLIRGRADPCAIDARGRPPYSLASSDKVREVFRKARGTLGEDRCRWDDDAKVGPALTEEDLEAKKAKEREKKRRQRARQKERKAKEKKEAQEEAAREEEEARKKKEEEDAKRARDGLKPKTSSATNVCDFCQKVAKGKRRAQMFLRLEYVYCSTDCVRRHQRELAAAAAVARMG
ncbi:hypothetical protein ACHAWF_015647 [Thalassiosira exigua]